MHCPLLIPGTPFSSHVTIPAGFAKVGDSQREHSPAFEIGLGSVGGPVGGTVAGVVGGAVAGTVGAAVPASVGKAVVAVPPWTH